MVFRLIIDAIRRKWGMAAFAVFQLHIFFPLVAKFWPSSPGMALTMSGAWFLSMAANDLFSSRVLYQLPVSRRTWWLARWWTHVVGPVLIAQVAVAIALWRAGSPWFDLEPTLLALTFGILYCGVGTAARTTSFGKSGDAPATLLSVVAFFPVIIGFVAAPFLLAPYLPHSFADVHAVWLVVMLVMAAFTVVGYRHHPEISARPDMRIARRFQPVTPIASGSPTPLRIEPPATGFFGRLTGAKMVLWEECRKQFYIFSTVIAIGIAWWAIGSQYRPWPPLSEVLRKLSLLPFSTPRAPIIEPIVFGALLVVANIADVWMTSRIRSLRTLPVSSSALGSLPVVLGVTTAGMLWLLLLALHGLVLRTLPSAPRLDLFLAFAALTAMARTIRFVAPVQDKAKSMICLAPIFAIWLAAGYFVDSKESWRPDLVQPGMVIGGLLALAASWAVMRLAVTRSSSMYRPKPAVPTV